MGTRGRMIIDMDVEQFQKVRQAVVVSKESAIRKLQGNIIVCPWQKFCENSGQEIYSSRS